MVDHVRLHDHQNRSSGTEAPRAASKKKEDQRGEDKLTYLDVHTEAVAGFAARLGEMAEAVSQAGREVTGDRSPILAVAMGIVGGDFVRTAEQARQAHLADIGRLSTVVAGIGAAADDAHARYAGTDGSVRSSLTAIGHS